MLTLFEDLEAREVEAEMMTKAITLAEFYLSEAARLAHAARISTAVERAERLRTWLLDSWEHDEILPSEVVQHAPIRALREMPAAQAALAMLVTYGWLTALAKGAIVRGSKRKSAFRIVRPSR